MHLFDVFYRFCIFVPLVLCITVACSFICDAQLVKMLVALSVICCSFILLFLKFLNLLDSPSTPRLHHSGSFFVKRVISKCPSLNQIYQPPKVWGMCGHIQTAIYGKLGRWNCPRPNGVRQEIKFPSGETATFDIFEPLNVNGSKECCTILCCPGICNSSEKKYVRTFVQFCIFRGYRVAVLNHIGSLPNVKLTSPRIFTYGDTKYFTAMVNFVMKAFPNSQFVVVGFSMGGNIACRYLAEDPSRQLPIKCAVSLCQGYDAVRSTTPLTKGYRRIYNYMVAANFKKVLKPHWKELFQEQPNDFNSNENKPTFAVGSEFDEEKVKRATTMQEIEDGLLRHFDGHSSALDYIQDSGCAHLIKNISLPILLLNAEDDPLIVKDVHDVPHHYSCKQDKALFVTTKHGGHLGFYKGKWYRPDDTTLLEDVVLEYIEAVLQES
uniref:Abhydrolase domain-containing protein 2-like n=1 Tax=Phallusia mammillata TaxID=59560 RepID=A0A6F9D4U1_9ASCI|nr:abhydrolase domain-containing protein 2-like [Phallusia mammillata]